jgi:hypothetical protein
MDSIEIYLNENGHFSLIKSAEKQGEVESSLLKGLKITLTDIFSQI